MAPPDDPIPDTTPTGGGATPPDPAPQPQPAPDDPHTHQKPPLSLSAGYSIEPASIYALLPPSLKAEVDKQLIQQLLAEFPPALREGWKDLGAPPSGTYVPQGDVRAMIASKLADAGITKITLDAASVGTVVYRIIGGEHRISNVEALLLEGTPWLLAASVEEAGVKKSLYARAVLSLSWGVQLSDMGLTPTGTAVPPPAAGGAAGGDPPPG